ncbi:Uncharacterised protein [Chlamydia trachomatis]|nr:Uncharacterised protein [Chlamydia trachomatis]
MLDAIGVEQDRFGRKGVVSFAENRRANGKRLVFCCLCGQRAVFNDGKNFSDWDSRKKNVAHVTSLRQLGRSRG